MMSAVQLLRTGTGFGLLIFLVAAMTGCGAKEEKLNTGYEAGTYGPPVEVAVVELKQLSVTKIYSGPLEGEEQANIIARLSERVTGVKIPLSTPLR